MATGCPVRSITISSPCPNRCMPVQSRAIPWPRDSQSQKSTQPSQSLTAKSASNRFCAFHNVIEDDRNTLTPADGSESRRSLSPDSHPNRGVRKCKFAERTPEVVENKTTVVSGSQVSPANPAPGNPGEKVQLPLAADAAITLARSLVTRAVLPAQTAPAGSCRWSTAILLQAACGHPGRRGGRRDTSRCGSRPRDPHGGNEYRGGPAR